MADAAIRRPHLLELEDQPWLPQAVRDAVTDYLQYAVGVGKVYHPAIAPLKEAFERIGARQVVDLGSGGGGPWLQLQEVLEATGYPVEVLLTDKFPNMPAFTRAQARNSRICFVAEPVDATDVPPELLGFRTLFSSFHHFPPKEARAVLEDAVRKGQGIGIFEGTERSLKNILLMLLTPLLVLLVTPFIRPVTASRLLLTYLVPIVPMVVLFDGLVSCRRTYTPGELRALVSGLGSYRWIIGDARGKNPLPVSYLIGYPKGPM